MARGTLESLFNCLSLQVLGHWRSCLPYRNNKAHVHLGVPG
jgi:hypothetical protein